MGAKKGKNLSEDTLLPRYEIVKEIKTIRKNQNMTQEELAELAGTKKSNISRLESGTYNPSLDLLITVAECLGKKIQVQIR